MAGGRGDRRAHSTKRHSPSASSCRHRESARYRSVVILSVLGVATLSVWTENRGHRGPDSFEGGPIKQSEREVWGDPSVVNAPPPRRKKGKFPGLNCPKPPGPRPFRPGSGAPK